LGALFASQWLIPLIPKGDSIAGTDFLEVLQYASRTGNYAAGNPVGKTS